jgi:uncharacterized protein YoxC
MTALYSLSMVLWQTPDQGLTSHDGHLLVICIIAIAVAMVVQAVIILTAGLAAMKTMKEFRDLAHDVHTRATPIMQQTTDLLHDVSPKIRAVTENVTQISYTVREKVDEVGETLSQVNRTVADANQRTRGQVDHVDRMVTSALNTTEEVAETVSRGIRIPIKQMAGMVAGLRVGLETLMKNFRPKGRGIGGDFE